jgi:DNA-binding CsgD family transcriptional regulator
MGRRGQGILARADDGSPSIIHVLPLNHGDLRAGLWPHAVAAVFVSPGINAPLPTPEQALAALFDLSPAEARVFSHIAAGRTRAATAEALGIGLATLKTHLHRIFAKTGTNRQAELVRLGATLSPIG